MDKDDEVLYDLGVDLNSSMDFVDGDLVLCAYSDNLKQAVLNRLNTDLNEMDLFYEEYGSILQNFFGWKANTETLSFMEAEIENVLENEPRLLRVECQCGYYGNGLVRIGLILHTSTDMEFDLNLVYSDTGVVEIETEMNINDDEAELWL